MSTSPALGEAKQVQLGQGTIRYRERGSGEPIVFVHGFGVNGDLWRKVVPEIAENFRCITPDWPLASHEIPMNSEADLSPPGVAKLIADFLAALDLNSVTAVGNNTGGAMCQLLVTNHPERVGRLILTNCDAYDNFPPGLFRYLKWIAFVPGAFFLLAQSLRLRPIQRSPIAYGWIAKRPIDGAALDSYVEHLASVRRDSVKVLKGISTRYTMAAGDKLGEFKRPVLIAWAPEGRFFPFKHAQKLSEAFADARLERVEDSYDFVSEDQPKRLAELITTFMHANPSPAVESK